MINHDTTIDQAHQDDTLVEFVFATCTWAAEEAIVRFSIEVLDPGPEAFLRLDIVKAAQ